MKIAHCQIECTPGDIEANIAKVVAGLERAEAEGIEIISFPESFLTGYFSDAAKAREHSFAIDGPEIRALLERTAGFSATFMVGFNERRDDDLYNTVLVAEKGQCLGSYSKVFPIFDYFTPGRRFPVFQRGEVTFGVVICADGGYIEPVRILALKGAQIIFAPHYNFLAKQSLINHFMSVRADHVARARENGVWFFRGNQVTSGLDAGRPQRDGVGYGDSYLMDPMGEIVVRSSRHVECMISANVDVSDQALLSTPLYASTRKRSIRSLKLLGAMTMELAECHPHVHRDP